MDNGPLKERLATECQPYQYRGNQPLSLSLSPRARGEGMLICQPNRGNNLKMPKMPKSVQCKGQFVTAPCRVVTVFVTGCPMLKSLIYNNCDGVTAPDPWTPRPLPDGCHPAPNPSQRYLKFGRRGAPPSREGRAPRRPNFK